VVNIVENNRISGAYPVFCFIKITLHLLISSAGQKELLDAEIFFIFKGFIRVAAKQPCLEG